MNLVIVTCTDVHGYVMEQYAFAESDLQHAISLCEELTPVFHREHVFIRHVELVGTVEQALNGGIK